MSYTLGLERERFIVNANSGKVVNAIGILLPRAQKIAKRRGLSKSRFTYELFAGQLEDRTPICKSLAELEEALLINDDILSEAVRGLDLEFSFSEFLEDHEIENLQVNPFNSRHQKIWESISPERQLSASRVAAVHVHVGVSSTEVVKLFSTYDEQIVERLIKLGDHSGRKRIVAYKNMAQIDGVVPKFSHFEGIMEYIEAHGGEKNVWDLVRYKPSTKTVEFRMFGSTPSVSEIIGYTQACLDCFQR